MISKFGFKNQRLFFSFLLWLGVLVTLVLAFVQLSPVMPGPLLDQSWMYGMNQAMAQRLVIGKDIIFTFGPYASIYTELYHPATDTLTVLAGLYLAISYWVCFFILMRSVEWYWVAFFCILLSGLLFLPDPLLFSFPLLVGLLTIKTISFESRPHVKIILKPLSVALIFSPLGLLPLIKGSLLMLCSAVIVLCSALFIVKRHRQLAIFSLLSPLLSMLFFWVSSGQSASSLPDYFTNMAPIVSGYTEAMAVDGNILEVILYLFASVFLLLAIVIPRQINITAKIFILLLYLLFLFVSFKAGFVRHDGHATIPGLAILIAATLLPSIIETRIAFPIFALALSVWFYIFCNQNDKPPSRVLNSILDNISLNYSRLWNGIINRITEENWLQNQYYSSVRSLKENASFPILQGSTDIYSSGQSYLIASGNLWSPRPIFQSYSAYTPVLAAINKNHLLGENAPENIIFKVEPIDLRIPSMEDGASWPILMENYKPTHIKNDFLFLKKIGRNSNSEELSKLVSENHSLGENVPVPHSNLPIFAQVELKPTLFGRLANILFKPSQLQITFELDNGIKKQYRIIAGMAKSGFVISPLIENTTNFAMLYGKPNLLDDKRVKSIAISPRDGRDLQWNNDYTITFSQIKTDETIDVSDILDFDRFDDELSKSIVLPARKCDGSIDIVNSISPVPIHISASQSLEMTGWLAVSVEESELPEAVYMVLTDTQGKHIFVNSRKTLRTDVGSYFKNNKLNNTGYAVMANISMLEGNYILGLAIKKSNTIQICPQFNIPVAISK